MIFQDMALDEVLFNNLNLEEQSIKVKEL